jgi:hypothetical protein
VRGMRKFIFCLSLPVLHCVFACYLSVNDVCTTIHPCSFSVSSVCVSALVVDDHGCTNRLVLPMYFFFEHDVDAVYYF